MCLIYKFFSSMKFVMMIFFFKSGAPTIVKVPTYLHKIQRMSVVCILLHISPFSQGIMGRVFLLRRNFLMYIFCYHSKV